MKRGEIWLVNLPKTNNSIQGGCVRPMILVSNNMSLLHSPVIHAVPVTSRKKPPLPTHVFVGTDCGIIFASTALCEQSMLLSKKDSLIKCVGMCNETTLNKIDFALAVQFGIENKINKNIG